MGSAIVVLFGDAATRDDRGMTPVGRRASRRCAALALVGALLACGADPGNSVAELRTALDAAYPEGWRFATLDDYWRSEPKAGERADWIGGDFDGDGRSDYAAQLVVHRLGHPGGTDSAQLVVALLRRRNRFERHVISVGGGPNTGVYLGRLARGETVHDYEGHSGETLTRDAVHQIFAGQASVAYVYDDGRWREIITAD
jgi:hypothetical protein